MIQLTIENVQRQRFLQRLCSKPYILTHLRKKFFYAKTFVDRNLQPSSHIDKGQKD